MEKIIYKNQDVSKLFNCKENAIIDLYAEKTHKSVMEARKIYNASKLKNVINNLDNELWLESEYYILDKYENLMEKSCVPVNPNAIVEDISKIQNLTKINGIKGRDATIISIFDKLSPLQQHQIERQMKMMVRIKSPKIGMRARIKFSKLRMRKKTNDLKMRKGEAKI